VTEIWEKDVLGAGTTFCGGARTGGSALLKEQPSISKSRAIAIKRRVKIGMRMLFSKAFGYSPASNI
jgi:hypothetical protein